MRNTLFGGINMMAEVLLPSCVWSGVSAERLLGVAGGSEGSRRPFEPQVEVLESRTVLSAAGLAQAMRTPLLLELGDPPLAPYELRGDFQTGQSESHASLQGDVKSQLLPAQSQAALADSWVRITVSPGDLGTWDVQTVRYDLKTGEATGPQARISLRIEGASQAPAIAAAEDGTLVAVWSERREGQAPGVFLRLFHADGTPATTALQVNASVFELPAAPVVSVSVSGDIAVAWDVADATDVGGVYTRKFNKGATPSTSEILVTRHTLASGQQAAAAIGADGSFAVAWAAADEQAVSRVHVREFDAAGTAALEDLVVAPSATAQSDPSLAIGAAGQLAVAWTESAADGSATVFLQRFDADGSADGEALLVGTTSADSESKPAVAFDTDGNVVVVWETLDPSGEPALAFRRYAADGSSVGGVKTASISAAAYRDDRLAAAVPVLRDGLPHGRSADARVERGEPHSGLVEPTNGIAYRNGAVMPAGTPDDEQPREATQAGNGQPLPPADYGRQSPVGDPAHRSRVVADAPAPTFSIAARERTCDSGSCLGCPSGE